MIEQLNFYLRNVHAKKKTMIFLNFNYQGSRLRIPTNLSINPKFWNEKKQRVKQIENEIDFNFYNDRLDSIYVTMSSLLKSYRDSNYYPSPKKIEEQFFNLNNIPIKNKRSKTFWDYFDMFVEEKRKTVKDIRVYKSCLQKHLLEVSLKMNQPLSFLMLEKRETNFEQEWHDYLFYEAINSKGSRGLAINTIGKTNKDLKCFLNWVFDNNFYPKFSLKKFKSYMEDVEKIYLSDGELEKIENVVLENVNESIVRDLFLIGCETGLRFSDFSNLSVDNILNDKIYMIPLKTENSHSTKIIIPLSNRVKDILKKYNGAIPKLSIKDVTNFNKIIREICKNAEITNLVIQYRTEQGKKQLYRVPKYQVVSSHTCRRSFCTNKFLKGMPSIALMKFSGHTTERNFLKYIKIDAEIAAEKYKSYF